MKNVYNYFSDFFSCIGFKDKNRVSNPDVLTLLGMRSKLVGYLVIIKLIMHL